MKTAHVITGGLLLASVLALPANATETPQEKGLRLSQDAITRDSGWQDMQADMLMVLRNSQGEESIREIRLKSLEITNDGDKSLSIFDKPLDVKGTAFLSFSHPVGADDQWLYLPALKRVKRIASRNKSGPFMGSEFAYEDLASFEIEKYTYQHLREEPCGDQTCDVIEQIPVDKYSGYTRRVVWLDQPERRLQQVIFYDRKNAKLKTLTYHDYQRYLAQYWRPDLMKMTNHQTGKSTDLRWSNYRFRTGLDDGDFNKNALKRAR